MTSPPPSPRPVRPKDAASLILLDRTARGVAVLMGRRAKRHRFLPDLFAFPGGRVDPADRSLEVLRPYRPEVARRLADAGSARLARALGCAAIRETFEETGLLVGAAKAGHIAADLSRLDYVARAITPSQSPIRFHARFFLADASAARGRLGGSGELVDLGWYPLGDALRLPVADVTEFVLQEMRHMAEAGQTARPAFWRYRSGSPRVDRD